MISFRKTFSKQKSCVWQILLFSFLKSFLKNLTFSVKPLRPTIYLFHYTAFMAKKNRNRATNGSFSKPTSTPMDRPQPRPVPNWSPDVLSLLRPPNANDSNQGRRESSRLRGVPALSHLSGVKSG